MAGDAPKCDKFCLGSFVVELETDILLLDELMIPDAAVVVPLPWPVMDISVLLFSLVERLPL